ncbi:hypothetical protein TPHA_0J00370 [Tetrapisispora phaffii CBS 4417]|uniref:HRDC domain-containing protein n=1 Tax=Tetrapisispora phaffii (strain ATCC 24235 / CBS 4417 / NBRC 1672 / NRRL Y-8282 / UCD 70-5) TaxID=1071381 RepID=G8BYB8_TETPH|nr:hypothetical protein TPHA_0J00370 [Tetrapisispora phaffii CBS 4417]CCE64860.1 hypothetical protein TPHA_0J00370 [Tetrapisispora phaffii CBS 4417]
MNADELLPLVVSSVRAASALAAQDVDFYRSLDKEIASSLTNTSQKVTDMINSIISSVDENSEGLVEGKENLDESWKDIGNLLDSLFELADHSIDALSKASQKSSNDPKMKYLNDSLNFESDNVTRLSKPQLNFSVPVDNSETHPFRPLLTDKPNAVVPLDEVLKIVDGTEDTPQHYPQPYETEIDKQEYNEQVLQFSDPIPSKVWEETEAIWVDNEESLAAMLNELKTATELAVDLEHHDFRSYYGITCLMQISTRNTDYLVDTIALRDKLQVLNVVFTDPKITKILHGAFMDIIWLQRDLGLYIVSLFDTYHASRALGFPRHSLAYLLERFAHFKTSKQYQLADWRTRPLSKAMNAYARADTHFLLNIFDQLRNMLIQEDKLASMLHESRKVAKRRFEYSKYKPTLPSSAVFSPTESDMPWRSMIYQYNIPSQKVELVKRLWEWRDTIARRDDESPRYIMPNQLIASLVEYVPTNPAGVISVNRMMTDPVRSNAKAIANLIKSTLEDMKNNNISTTVVSTTAKDKETSSNDLSTSQIKFIVSQFENILEKYSSNNSNLNDVTSKEGKDSLVFSKIFNSRDDIITYDKGTKHLITEQQLSDRQKEVDAAMKQAEEIAFSMEVQDTHKESMKQPFPEPEEVISQSHLPAFEDKEEQEDLDEIIVLKDTKDRRNRQHRGRGRSADSDHTVIDYSKGDKILSQDNRRRTPNKRKYDPFSADNNENALQGAKRRRPTAKNRNVSFKR